MLWFACRFISLPFTSFLLPRFGVAILANIPTHFSKGSKGRERERDRDTQRGRERHRERQRQGDRQTGRDNRRAGRQTDRQTDRQADGQTIKQRKRDRQRQGLWQRDLCRSCMSDECKCSLLKPQPTPY